MDFLGIFAAVCSTSASMPQLIDKKPRHLNQASLMLRGTSGISWAVYGFLMGEYALMVSSSIVFVIECILFVKSRVGVSDQTSANDT